MRIKMILYFKKDMQKAFQYSLIRNNGTDQNQVLPNKESRIHFIVNVHKAFETLLNDTRLGGTIITYR